MRRADAALRVLWVGAALAGACPRPAPVGPVAPVAPTSYTRRVAAVVAIDDYPGAGDLSFAVAQGRRVAGLLRARGFEVHELIDPPPSGQVIRDRLAAIAPTVGYDGLFLLYFAGQAQTRETREGAALGFLVGADGAGVSMSELRDVALLRGAARHSLFVIEAAFSGLQLRDGGAAGRGGGRDAIQVLAAGRGGEKSHGGLLTRVFLDAISSPRADYLPDGFVTGSEICRYVTGQVAAESGDQQHPQCGWLYGEGEVAFDLRGVPALDPGPGGAGSGGAGPGGGAVAGPGGGTGPGTFGALPPDDAERERRWHEIRVLRETDQLPDAALLERVRAFLRDYRQGNPYLVDAMKIEGELTARLTASRVEEAYRRTANTYRSAAMTARDKMAVLTDFLARHPNSRWEGEVKGWIIALKPRAEQEERAATLVSAWTQIPDPLPGDIEGRRRARDRLQTFVREYPKDNPYLDRAKRLLARLENDHALDVGYEYVPLAGGTFTMGSASAEVGRALCSEFAQKCEAAWFADEVSARPVQVSAFQIGRTEVTNAQYRACVWAGECAPPHYDDQSCNILQGTQWAPGRAPADLQEDGRPVVCIDWKQAEKVCRWLTGCAGEGCGLPSEAQWEYAARGTRGQDRTFPWGHQRDVWARANYCDLSCRAGWHDTVRSDGFSLTAPVGSFPAGATPDGVHDLAGNVWEWMADYYADSYDACGRACQGRDPRGPAGGTRRAMRGGGWFDGGNIFRTADRNWNDPAARFDFLGVRCVRPPDER